METIYRIHLVHFLTYVITYWTFSAIFYYIDQYKNADQNYQKIQKSSDKILKQVIFNHIIGSLILTIFTHYLWNDNDSIQIYNSIQHPLMIIMRLFIVYYVYDLMFYPIHRLVHTKYFYWIHKLHHEYNMPVGYATHYSSIYEHVFLNLLPSIIATRLVCCNEIAIAIWIFVSTANTICAHSGYGKKTKITDWTHYYHHMYHNVNYSVSGYFDMMFGTYIKGDKKN